MTSVRRKGAGLLMAKQEFPNYLCFIAEEANSTISMSVIGSPDPITIYTSTDRVNWSAFTPGTTTITLANIGDKVWFYGENETVGKDSGNYFSFIMTGKIMSHGSIMSLLSSEDSSWTVISKDFSFNALFQGCTSLTTAPELPATTLAPYCYYTLFYECASLTTAPELPATTLAPYCYYYMFTACTSLTTVPELPATTLTESCYRNMFRGCISLRTPPKLQATDVANNSCQSMFESCISLDTVPELLSTNLNKTQCYSAMFLYCTNIKVSTTRGAEYQYEWRIPKSGSGSAKQYWNFCMLTNTGGTFTGDPSINTTYYTTNPPV